VSKGAYRIQRSQRALPLEYFSGQGILMYYPLFWPLYLSKFLYSDPPLGIIKFLFFLPNQQHTPTLPRLFFFLLPRPHLHLDTLTFCPFVIDVSHPPVELSTLYLKRFLFPTTLLAPLAPLLFLYGFSAIWLLPDWAFFFFRHLTVTARLCVTYNGSPTEVDP